MSLYKIMELQKNATSQQIQDQYKLLAKKCHPDKAAAIAKATNCDMDDVEDQLQNKFKQLQQAYSVLSDAEARKHYDETGETPGKSESFESVLNQSFMNLFRGAVSAVQSPKTTDLVKMMHQLVKETQQHHSQQITNSLASARKLTQIKKRISGPDSGMHIDILKQDFKKIRIDIKNNKQQLKLFKALKELVDQYSYKIDEQDSDEYLRFRNQW